jgi:hypothetical protein
MSVSREPIEFLLLLLLEDGTAGATSWALAPMREAPHSTCKVSVGMNRILDYHPLM